MNSGMLVWRTFCIVLFVFLMTIHHEANLMGRISAACLMVFALNELFLPRLKS